MLAVNIYDRIEFRRLKEETSRLYKPEDGGEPMEPSKMPQREKGLSFLYYPGLYESMGERYGGADVWR